MISDVDFLQFLMGIHVTAYNSIIDKPLHSVLFMYISRKTEENIKFKILWNIFCFDIKYKPPAS